MTAPDMDLSPFAEAKSDRMTGDDLIGGPRTIKITAVTGAIEDGKKQAIIHFEGDAGKPFKPCKTMVRLMMAVWGKYASEYVGRFMTIYRDPEVTFGALATGGVRISHMSHMDGEAQVIVSLKKGKKGAVKVKPLIAEVKPMAQAKGTAEQWASDHIAAVQSAGTAEALADLIAKGARPMGKLEQDKPALWTEINQAYAARRAQIDAEGKPDTDMGEGFTDDESTDWGD